MVSNEFAYDCFCCVRNRIKKDGTKTSEYSIYKLALCYFIILAVALFYSTGSLLRVTHLGTVNPSSIERVIMVTEKPCLEEVFI